MDRISRARQYRLDSAGPVPGSFVDGNEHYSSIEDGDFIDPLSDYKFHKVMFFLKEKGLDSYGKEVSLMVN
jgi:hypothetical protein